MTGVAATIAGALTIAAVSTLGDFVWATWIPRHWPTYGLTHGALLFLSIGLFLGALARRPAAGAAAGVVIGVLAAGTFYLLEPLAGYSSMFLVWTGVWVALAGLNGCLDQKRIDSRKVMARGTVAAVASGAAFYAISAIWRPFDPRGWDYAVHLGAWTAAYLPGFGALLLSRERRSPDVGGSPGATG